MGILLIVLLGQFVFAVIVALVLKRILDKELLNAALEKFESCPYSTDVTSIEIHSAGKISDLFRAQFESIAKRKMPEAELKFELNGVLKGGVVIVIGEEILDFSLKTRLQHMWR